jgi:hypothetical protein
MWNSLKSYLNLLKLTRIILGSLLAFLGILFLMKIVFPLLGQLTFLKTWFQDKSYYSLFAITLVFLIPYVLGMVYANVLREERGYQSSDLQYTPAGKNYMLVRMFFATIICFVFVLLTILMVKPVPSEGWLRNLFATCLLSIQAPFFCLLICTLERKNVKRVSVFVLCSIFLIIVPFGLLVHHPWNYFVFFSPLYWVSWAWIVRSPLESLLYGTISVIITLVSLILFLRSLLEKKGV